MTASDTATLQSPFDEKELDKFKNLLKQRRQEIKQDISDLFKDAMDSEDGHTAPTHQADRGSDMDMQDLSLEAMGNEEELLWQIDRALRKIETGRPLVFGICEYTRQPIPKSRLRLLPWTPLSIEGANYIEEQGITIADLLLED